MIPSNPPNPLHPPNPLRETKQRKEWISVCSNMHSELHLELPFKSYGRS